MKRRLQTRAGHERELAAAHHAARAHRNQAAARSREAAHAHLRGTEHRWARAWTDRGTATPLKIGHARDRIAAGITSTSGDTVDAAALTAAIEQQHRDRVVATITRQPAQTFKSGRDGPATSPSRAYSPSTPDRDRGR